MFGQLWLFIRDLVHIFQLFLAFDFGMHFTLFTTVKRISKSNMEENIAFAPENNQSQKPLFKAKDFQFLSLNFDHLSF